MQAVARFALDGRGTAASVPSLLREGGGEYAQNRLAGMRPVDVPSPGRVGSPISLPNARVPACGEGGGSTQESSPTAWGRASG